MQVKRFLLWMLTLGLAPALSAQTLTVHNYGSAPVSVWGSALVGTNKTEFRPTNRCPVPPATLAASGSCSITVQFSPTSAGAKNASLLISHDGGGGPGSVSLTGTGASALGSLTSGAPAIFVPTILPTAGEAREDQVSSADGERKAKAARNRPKPPEAARREFRTKFGSPGRPAC